MISSHKEYSSPHNNAYIIPLRQLPWMVTIIFCNLQMMKRKPRDTKQFAQPYNGCDIGNAKCGVKKIIWPSQTNKNK